MGHSFTLDRTLAASDDPNVVSAGGGPVDALAESARFVRRLTRI